MKINFKELLIIIIISSIILGGIYVYSKFYMADIKYNENGSNVQEQIPTDIFYGKNDSRIKESDTTYSQYFTVEVLNDSEFNNLKGNAGGIVIIYDPEKKYQYNVGPTNGIKIFYTQYDKENNWYTFLKIGYPPYNPTGQIF